MVRRGARRTLAVTVAASLLASGAARADTTVKIASIPAYILAIAAVLTGCSSASDGESPWNRDGYYAQLGGMLAVEDFGIGQLANPDATPAGPLRTSQSGGIHGALGYRCHPRVAVEASAEWIAGFNLDNANKKTLTGATTTANVKMYLMTERIQPFLLVGIGATFLNHRPVNVEIPDPPPAGNRSGVGKAFAGKEEDISFRLGGGLDLYATDQLAVSLGTSYVLPTDKLDDLSYISFTLGLQYNF